MKFLKGENKKYLYWGVTAVLVVIVSILCNNILTRWNITMGVFKLIVRAIQPIIFGIIFAYVLNPLLGIYEKYVFGKLFGKIMQKKPQAAERTARGVSILFTVATGVAIVAGLLTMIIPELWVNVVRLVNNLPGYIENGRDFLLKLADENPTIVNSLIKELDTASKDLMEFLTTKFLPNANALLAKVSIGIYGTLKTLLNLIIGVIAAVYILSSKEHYAALARKMAYAFMKKESAEKAIRLVKYTDDRFGGFLVGKIVDSAIIGVICFIVCSIFRIPYALLVSAVVGVTNVIPFFGPFIGAIPSAVLILLVDPIKAVTFGILIIIIQQVDGNIIGPKILGDKTGLDSFGVMFSILFAGGLFGIAGMILGVPVFAVIFGIIHSVCDKNLEEKKLPTESEVYETDESFKKAVKAEPKAKKET